MRDVVTVTDVAQDATFETAVDGPEGLQVSQRLTWMFAVGQGVDHRDRGVLSELLEPVLTVGPHHDRVHVPRQHLRRIGDRLATTKLELVRGQRQSAPAKLADRGLERHAGPGRWLLE